MTTQLTIMPTSLMLWLPGSLDGEEDEAKEWEYWALHRTLQVSSISWISQASSRHPIYLRLIHTPIWAQQSAICLFSKQMNRKYLEGMFIDNHLYYRAEETYGREEVWLLWIGNQVHLQYLPQAILVNGPSLPAGTHYIPFSLNLPHGAPSTYEGDHGHVRWGHF